MRLPADPSVELRGVIHFTGGFLLGSAPAVSYLEILEGLADQGYCVIATPIPAVTREHQAAATQALKCFNRAYACLSSSGARPPRVVGLGHSLGGKLTALMGCAHPSGPRRAGNVFLCFNNFPSTSPKLDFSPPPAATWAAIGANYLVPLNVLVRFSQDGLDQSMQLLSALPPSIRPRAQLLTLPGSHTSPNGPWRDETLLKSLAAAIDGLLREDEDEDKDRRKGEETQAQRERERERGREGEQDPTEVALVKQRVQRFLAEAKEAEQAVQTANAAEAEKEKKKEQEAVKTKAEEEEEEEEEEEAEAEARQKQAEEEAKAEVDAEAQEAASTAAAATAEPQAKAVEKAEAKAEAKAEEEEVAVPFGLSPKFAIPRPPLSSPLSFVSSPPPSVPPSPPLLPSPSASPAMSKQGQGHGQASAAPPQGQGTTEAEGEGEGWPLDGDWEQRLFLGVTGFGADSVKRVSSSGRVSIASMQDGAETYGEISSAGLRNVLRAMETRAGQGLGKAGCGGGLTASDSMVDLGSGVGKIVAFFAFETSVGSALGVELGSRRSAASSSVLFSIASDQRGAGLSRNTQVAARMKFMCDDVLSEAARREWCGCSVIFVNAVAFPPTLWSRIQRVLVRDCPSLRHLIIAGPVVAVENIGIDIDIAGEESGREEEEETRQFLRQFDHQEIPASASWDESFTVSLYSRK